MKQPAYIALALAAAAATSGCGSFRQALGVEKVAPDEFRVVTKAPLVIPPDYALRPPRPGDPRPQELRPDVQAVAAVFGRDVGAEASAGERQLVVRAGAGAVDPRIRAQVDLEGGDVVRKPEDFSDRVIGAAEPANPAGEEDSVRRATGGGEVVIQREARGSKLPGL